MTLVAKTCFCRKEIMKVPCSRTSVSCGQVCGTQKLCHHFCDRICHSDRCDEKPCQSTCSKLRKCGHICQRVCHLGDCEEEKCTNSCEADRECGHACKQPCHYNEHTCLEFDCAAQCGKSLACSHPCAHLCHYGTACNVFEACKGTITLFCVCHIPQNSQTIACAEFSEESKSLPCSEYCQIRRCPELLATVAQDFPDALTKLETLFQERIIHPDSSFSVTVHHKVAIQAVQSLALYYHLHMSPVQEISETHFTFQLEKAPGTLIPATLVSAFNFPASPFRFHFIFTDFGESYLLPNSLKRPKVGNTVRELVVGQFHLIFVDGCSCVCSVSTEDDKNTILRRYTLYKFTAKLLTDDHFQVIHNPKKKVRKAKSKAKIQPPTSFRLETRNAFSSLFF